MNQSCTYVGQLRHIRLAPRRHRLSHRVALSFVDLDDPPDPLCRRRPGIVRLRRSDFLPDAAGDTLAAAVRSTVASAGMALEPGPVHLLANLRTFGRCFNPAAFYLCGSESGALQAAVVEVTNTPWGERHAYVLGGRSAPAQVLSGQLDKALHVSPFMAMHQRYRWRVTAPGDRLRIDFSTEQEGRTIFHASLDLRRQSLGAGGFTDAALRRPVPSIRTLALIYGHAAVLRAKGVPPVAHP